MRVVLSAAFGAGAFYYAEQLSKRGLLHRFLTSRPDVFSRRVDRSQVRLNIGPELLTQIWRRLPVLRSVAGAEYAKAQWFDRWASNRIESADIVVAFAAFALHTMRAAKSAGAVTVLERGSAHIVEQHHLVNEERRRVGLQALRESRLFEKQLQEYEEADYIAVPSRFAFDSYVRAGVRADRLIRVPIGVDLEWFSPAQKRDEVFRILIFGGGLRKGTQYLLEAFRRITDRASELVIVGALSDDVEPVLRKYAGSYRLAGRISHRNLAALYATASVLVAPSIEDGWGLVVGEAMACGVPVVVSENTGAADMVRDGIDGFIVPVRDVDGITTALLTFREDENRRVEMGRCANARAQEFSWDRYGDNIAAEYARVRSLATVSDTAMR
jgi:glycosyltransferase involved in cell wall biosynthesis